MVDRTHYVSEDKMPKLALRQIFGRQQLSEHLCLAATEMGLLSIDTFAILGDSLTTAKDILKRLWPDLTALGPDPPRQEIALMSLAAYAARRARVEEDPLKVPETPQEDYVDFRARFVDAHPDVILIDAQKIYGAPFYEFAEIRTWAVQRSGLTRNAEDLLTISKADEPDQVTDMSHEFLMISQCRWAPFSICLWREMVSACGAADASLPDEILAGLRIDWKASLKDVEEGSALGPFFAYEEVDRVINCHDWIPTQRKNKVRGYDSATINGINLATEITKKLQLPSTDSNVAVIRMLR
ncbi:unnamed protein product [Effrenium voratum]|uniref:Uncharacterized protein n=1 Tax=Effrenium voratum TaxID=2562239 RepID=A0AA36I021_9DINO|nr:unnamed protein product [Effrenium voratum]